jgi:L-histidine N-alpha-methyltransferase
MSINLKTGILPFQRQFRQEILEGLNRYPKQLPSKYFYDAAGDRLFQEIMQLPEYYLTHCETEILAAHSAVLAMLITSGSTPFNLIELGPGDCTKTIHLLRALTGHAVDFTFCPIDISEDVISDLGQRLPKELPGLQITGYRGEYLTMLDAAASGTRRRNCVLFLGGNIGNMLFTEALEFGRQLRNRLQTGDMVIIGFDLKKSPAIIRTAYDDPAGVTRAFNLNLLTRINRELDGNFDVSTFDHYCSYDPANGACKSYLISVVAQQVNISGEVISFEKDEYIWAEISQKYSIEQINQMAIACGFKTRANFFDSRQWFTDTVWTAV